jgi:poly(hydroxyalkanoate) depolymerase family esterase
MKSNTKMTELLRGVSDLALTIGPGNALRTMQRALLRPVPSKDGATTTQFDAPDAPPSRLPRHIDKRARMESNLPSLRRVPSSWPYAKAHGPARRSRNKQETKITPAYRGQFVQGSVTNQAGSRSYKLYIPSCYHGQPLPLVVMLHGCKQDPDDFATGTRMNAIAEEKECFVLYPAQSPAANRPKCWSWFNAADQERERGEPSLIADTIREVIRAYHIDESMVYIAGLSAGGAMAVIMATNYPEMFAAAAVHSGMPYNAATSLFSALSAMKHGPRVRRQQQDPAASEAILSPVPMIVFHGDADKVVHPSNGEQVVKEAVSTLGGATPGTDTDPVAVTSVIRRELPEGRSYTRTIYHDEGGQNIAEQWVIHGAGHAWSGGCSDGSYTDPLGPDATNEMMRFFYEKKLPAS